MRCIAIGAFTDCHLICLILQDFEGCACLHLESWSSLHHHLPSMYLFPCAGTSQPFQEHSA